MRTVILISGILIAESINPTHMAGYSTAVMTFMAVLVGISMVMDIVDFFSKK